MAIKVYKVDAMVQMFNSADVCSCQQSAANYIVTPGFISSNGIS